MAWCRDGPPDAGGSQNFWLTFSNWKLMVFGLALIVMMRFRPEGLLPSARVQQELHTEATVGLETTAERRNRRLEPMALLALKKLTVRFGGLTAVNALDCQLDEHQIVSIIGPNGAGKTTAFNAITGIYQPTSGSIEFDGRELMRTLGTRIIVAALLVGLATALAAALAAVNVDRLWQAAIKQNYAGPGEPFSYATAWQSAGDYLAGRLRVARAPGNRWSVVTADGRRTLAYADDLAQAEQLRDRLTTLVGYLVADPGRRSGWPATQD